MYQQHLAAQANGNGMQEQYMDDDDEEDGLEEEEDQWSSFKSVSTLKVFFLNLTSSRQWW